MSELEWNPVWNTSRPDNGGDPHVVNVNAPFDANGYHMVWIMACTAVVWPIIPGIGLLYGGLARRKASLALLWQSFLVSATISFQWWVFGYTLTYSPTAGPFIGDFRHIGLRDVAAKPIGFLPEILFAVFQCFFCVATVQIMIGGALERGRLVPSLVFSFIWATVVYCPIACWTWNSNGWLYNLPSLDYAGGGPVHIASGMSALAYALVLGKRKERSVKHRPHNVTMVFLGTCFIWFGWLCFNGGSTLNATVRAMYAMFNTNIAASTGIMGWVLTDYFRKNGKFSVVGACEGAIAGLVGITPAAGYVPVWSAALIGFVTAAVCASLEDVTDWINIDEGMDVFKLHGIGGIVGSILTGIFAHSDISMLDGVTNAPGAVDGNAIQIAYQLADVVSISAYAFTASAIILFVMKYIPGLSIRAPEKVEVMGIDAHEFHNEEVGDWGMVQKDHDILGSMMISPPRTPQGETVDKSA
ncbi:ammonium transporter-like protein [Tricharina praecox]|uniref:ammonium transporter-like protein n=1 Tax=Tricharina praecox TaxID=43433 RepID=UPI00221F5471|nr:ammonium transporter-like protein [Tricharina praecox]KAI5858773.1 ammonium transporter-like protein [Tricharina praecox]